MKGDGKAVGSETVAKISRFYIYVLLTQIFKTEVWQLGFVPNTCNNLS